MICASRCPTMTLSEHFDMPSSGETITTDQNPSMALILPLHFSPSLNLVNAFNLIRPSISTWPCEAPCAVNRCPRHCSGHFHWFSLTPAYLPNFIGFARTASTPGIRLFHRNTSVINDVCYLQDLFTKSESRNAGIGRKLILAVYEKARERHSPRVYWQTQHDNRIAKHLYDKVAEHSGFEVYRKSFPEFTESKF